MDTKADMDGAMVELPGGIEAIRALDSAQTEGARIEARSEQLRKKEMRHRRAMAFYDCLKFVNEAFFSVLVIALSVLLASRGAITVGTVLTAYLCFTQLTGPLRELHRILDEFSECVVLANDYFRLSGLPLDFSCQDEGASKARTPRDNGVTLKDVRFAYPEKPDQLILNDIVLAIPAGKFIGIAGPSGCGKSSLIKVIDKLEEAQGEVLLGGVPPDSLSRTVLAENVALVPQTPFLTADTVCHSIRYGMKREVSPTWSSWRAAISLCWPKAVQPLRRSAQAYRAVPHLSQKPLHPDTGRGPPPRWTTPPKSASRPRSRK